MKITNNFSLKELTASDTAKAKQINNMPGYTQVAALKALCENVLQPLREHLGKPIHIKSGYRSPELNKAIGGSSSSDHCAGRAADIKVDGLTAKELATIIVELELPFDQLIGYVPERGGHIHISFRNGANRAQRLWAGSKGGYEPWSL